MKKFFFAICALAVVLFTASCDPKNKPINVDDLAEDGVYVFGAATGYEKVDPVLLMANGINEAKDQSARDGMFEKYIVLEGGKEFSLVWVNAGNQTLYGADLKDFTLTAEEVNGIYDSNPVGTIFKGKLETGDAAPKMKMATTGLYHIVLDLNKNNDLTEAQILVAPVEWGVRGNMNGWGFTKMEATPASNDGITYVCSGQELVNGLTFKFAYNGAWKITLDDKGEVKANTNLGTDCQPGGADIAVEKTGIYKITLTFKLAAGAVSNCFTYKTELTQEVEVTAPENMYMIGEQWGNWAWDSDGVVELSGMPNAPGYFWCTRYFDSTKGFKFCAIKEWSGDFTGEGTVGYTTHDGNCWVEKDGFYTVFVNGNDKVVEIMPAEVYGIGDAWGADAWDFNGANVVKFEADGQVLKAVVNANSTAVRLASKVLPSAPIDGLTTGNGWIDWWKTEFIYFDGKIAYRGAGGDQERVAVTAGDEITIDFNAGTVTVGAPFAGAITIDGDFADWAGVTTGQVSEKETPVYMEFKVTNDEKFMYFYSKRNKADAIWNGGAYIYYNVDGDNNPETGVKKDAIVGLENWVWFKPFGGTSSAPAIATEVTGEQMSTMLNNLKFAGKVSDDFVEVEVRIPLTDVNVKKGDVIGLNSWSNKSGDDLKAMMLTYTVL